MILLCSLDLTCKISTVTSESASFYCFDTLSAHIYFGQLISHLHCSTCKSYSLDTLGIAALIFCPEYTRKKLSN